LSVASLRVVAGGIVARTSDRVFGALFVLAGGLLVYLVLFDQGAAATMIFGVTGGRENLLHEFFHDGRHLWNAPCH